MLLLRGRMLFIRHTVLDPLLRPHRLTQRPNVTCLDQQTVLFWGSAPYLWQSSTSPKQPNSRPLSLLWRARDLSPPLHREPLALPYSRRAPPVVLDPLKFGIANCCRSRVRDNKYRAFCRRYLLSDGPSALQVSVLEYYRSLTS
ncbi:hypothetical protein HBH79_214110 [Parastagonospora nodorum]|nr:hypothetical protein HBI13_191380 [Parastagonospora nodorum]KAH4130649.1 hypothetical protein HBH45_198710 [Parastagonospora nodorum]KAH4147881.1 hypothetical protein HBH44_217880 [Parastagonospora nodorum]KAH4408419.1 hypothetical protein HBH93_227170 [Parastagonospora nodorum]KAH4573678.1 hypothetical protein HBH83_210270 [Parastagonospora nodorum]